MRKKKGWMVAGLLIFSAGMASGAGNSEKLSVLRADQNRLKDGEGREVILRGVNTGGRSKMPPFFPFDPEPDFETALNKYADRVQSLGFNVVRLLVIYEAGEPARGKYDQDYLQKYDAMVEAFARRGIYIIIDSHQDLYSRRLCGDGLPDWALPEKYQNDPAHADCRLWSLRYFTNPVASTADRFWSNADGVQDSYAAFFRMLAERYKNEPAVIGFEPINEPFPGWSGMAHYSEWNQEHLFRLDQKVAKAVQSADPRYLILVDLCPLENQGAWNPRMTKPEINNLVLAPHYYDPGTFGIPFGKAGQQKLIRRGLTRDRALGDFWNSPALLTEYGISPLFKSAPSYINKLYGTIDQLLLSGTFWEASISKTVWNLENTSIFEPDGSLRPGALALDRPYPRAVSGKIDKFSFDPETGELELGWRENPELKSPTEIYLPERIYGGEPSIILEPEGEFTVDRQNHLLSVSPLSGKSQRRLMVKP